MSRNFAQYNYWTKNLSPLNYTKFSKTTQNSFETCRVKYQVLLALKVVAAADSGVAHEGRATGGFISSIGFSIRTTVTQYPVEGVLRGELVAEFVSDQTDERGTEGVGCCRNAASFSGAATDDAQAGQT